MKCNYSKDITTEWKGEKKNIEKKYIVIKNLCSRMKIKISPATYRATRQSTEKKTMEFNIMELDMRQCVINFLHTKLTIQIIMYL